jgi:outer membrane protein assembly factor BamC
MKRTSAPSKALSLLALSILMTGCSTFESDKVEYKSAGKAPALDIPPDLTKIASEPRYAIPSTGSVSASGFEDRAVSPAGAAPDALGDARIERLGNQRWLVITRPADKVWDPLVEFWKDNGFLLVSQDKTVGIMETDWAENRAKIPQDFIRKTIGKFLDALYSTAERDKFRTRIERNSQGQTEIFITHRGMQEVDRSAPGGTEVKWAPRPADPELEVEFLRRLMVKLGASAEQANAAVAGAAIAKPVSELSKVNGQPILRVTDAFDRAWRRVGLSLDRTGFTVEDRDRSKGVYYVRYVENSDKDKEEPGFFSKLFSSTTTGNKGPIKYQISLKSEGQNTYVTVLNDKGAPETSAVVDQILKLIKDDLK